MTLIQEFQDQLDSKDNHYIKSMQRMHTDIERLITSMMDQFKEMRDDYSD